MGDWGPAVYIVLGLLAFVVVMGVLGWGVIVAITVKVFRRVFGSFPEGPADWPGRRR